MPQGLSALVGKLNTFPIARWNFLIFEPQAPLGGSASFTAGDQEFLGNACVTLKREFPEPYQFQCHLTSNAPKALLADWARDLPLRQPMQPVPETLQAINVTLSKAALPMDSDVRALLRADPFSTYQDLLGRIEAQKLMKLQVRNDFLVDPTSGRVMVPMLLSHDPLATAATARIKDAVEALCKPAGVCDRVGFLGGHFATLENKTQIIDDLSSVSWSSLAALLVALTILVWLRQIRLLAIIAPVTIGAALAALAVVAKDGWIHGLTLSFGSALVGLSVDYGVLAAFHPRRPAVWRSNCMGLLTTLLVLGVLSFTAIPVLRQLMWFAGFGLLFAFAGLYLMHRFLPTMLVANPLKLPKFESAWPARCLGLVVLTGAIGLFAETYDFNVQKLNYASKKTQVLYQWFRTTTKLTSLFLFHDVVDRQTGGESHADSSLLDDLNAEKDWSNANAVRLETAANYLPSLARQQANRSTWFTPNCEYRFAASLNATQQRFFAPFLQADPCEAVHVQTLVNQEPPAYLRHLGNGHAWLTIFFPETAVEDSAVRRKYPEAFSLVDIGNKFPALFKSELVWMTPLTLLLIAAVLALYYRSLLLAVTAILPFFAGVGAIVLGSVVTREPFNFVTMVALLMLAGFSVDYGIFAVDQWRGLGPEPGRTQSALIFCCLSSTLGVLPMAIAAHPVLHTLGVSLCLGLIGALTSSFLVIPAFLNWQKAAFGRRREPHA